MRMFCYMFKCLMIYDTAMTLHKKILSSETSETLYIHVYFGSLYEELVSVCFGLQA